MLLWVKGRYEMKGNMRVECSGGRGLSRFSDTQVVTFQEIKGCHRPRTDYTTPLELLPKERSHLSTKTGYKRDR